MFCSPLGQTLAFHVCKDTSSGDPSLRVTILGRVTYPVASRTDDFSRPLLGFLLWRSVLPGLRGYPDAIDSRL